MGGFQSKRGTTTTTTSRKKGTSQISATDRAMLDLKNARDKLHRYKQQLEQDEHKLVERAIQAKQKKDTRNALWLLKIRKIKLKEVDMVEKQLFNVLQMVQTIDSKQNEEQVLKAMKQGKDTLARMHEETTVDDILNLMDDIQEQHELETEMNKAFMGGTPDTLLSVEEEAAVEAELEALMMPDLPVQPNTEPFLPQVPTTKLPDPKEAVVAKQTSRTKTEEGRVALPS